MSNISKRRKEGSRAKIKSMGEHKEFLKRITKTLYYGQLPSLPCLSLPVTEISCAVWSEWQRGRSVRRLHADAAARAARGARVSPCALVLAVLYLERLQACNPDYLANTPPADLFLVSLMVGSKFLQDDGEAEEVVCAEWAAAGGVPLPHLHHLEIQFLDAIDWNVYVSDDAFEAGLVWLERQVALKQALPRGFFTYTDLAATCDSAMLGELARALSAAWLAVTASYLTSVLAFLTSTLVVSHAWLPALHYIAARNHSNDTSISQTIRNDVNYVNATNNISSDTFSVSQDSLEKLTCCNDWLKYQDSVDVKKNWNDNIVIYDWSAFDTWWSKTSVLNWLYQSSLVNPMQRWLEKIDEYTESFRIKPSETNRIEQCHQYLRRDDRRCIHQWLNLSKLSALVVTVSDR